MQIEQKELEFTKTSLVLAELERKTREKEMHQKAELAQAELRFKTRVHEEQMAAARTVHNEQMEAARNVQQQELKIKRFQLDDPLVTDSMDRY